MGKKIGNYTRSMLNSPFMCVMVFTNQDIIHVRDVGILGAGLGSFSFHEIVKILVIIISIF